MLCERKRIKQSVLSDATFPHHRLHPVPNDQSEPATPNPGNPHFFNTIRATQPNTERGEDAASGGGSCHALKNSVLPVGALILRNATGLSAFPDRGVGVLFRCKRPYQDWFPRCDGGRVGNCKLLKPRSGRTAWCVGDSVSQNPLFSRSMEPARSAAPVRILYRNIPG